MRIVSADTAAVAAAVLVIVIAVAATIVVVVEISIVVAERCVMTAAGICTGRGVHAQQTAQNGIDVCFGFDWRLVR